MPSTKKISIYDLEFDITQPYEEGQTINAHEAKTLNQTRGENISNNFRSEVKKVLDLPEGAEREAKLDELRSRFAQYDAEYSFASGGGRVSDPVERRARQIIKDAFSAHLATQGRKLKDVPAEDLEAAILRNLTPEVLADAKKRLEAEKKQADKTKGLLQF